MDLWKSDVFGRLLLELDKDCLEHTVSLCIEVIESKSSMQQTWKGSSKVRKGRFAANTVLDCDATTEEDKAQKKMAADKVAKSREKLEAMGASKLQKSALSAEKAVIWNRKNGEHEIEEFTMSII